MFQIFGSKSSIDYDVLIFINKIPSSIDESHNLIKKLNVDLSLTLTDKKINSNIGIIDNGLLTWCFKGFCSEINKMDSLVEEI